MSVSVIIVGIVIILSHILSWYRRTIRLKNGLWSSNKDIYLSNLNQYLLSDISNLVLDYICDIPVEYNFAEMFLTQDIMNTFTMDDKYLYTIEKNAIKKYNVNDRVCIQSWNFIEKLDDLYLYGISVNEKLIVIINYLTYEIYIYTKNGIFIRKITFKFDPPYYFPYDQVINLDRILNYCAELFVPKKEKIEWLKTRITQEKIISRNKFYNVAITNDLIYVSLHKYLLCFDFNGNIIDHNYNLQKIRMICDLCVLDNELIIKTDCKIIIGDTEWDANNIFKKVLYDFRDLNIITMRHSNNTSNQHLAVYKKNIFVGDGKFYDIYNLSGKKLGSVNNIDKYIHNKFYINNNKIYVMLLDSYYMNQRIGIYELIY